MTNQEKLLFCSKKEIGCDLSEKSEVWKQGGSPLTCHPQTLLFVANPRERNLFPKVYFVQERDAEETGSQAEILAAETAFGALREMNLVGKSISEAQSSHAL